MARGGFPSMTALLGLLAVAGYQNRDKLGAMLNGNRTAGQDGRPAALDNILGNLGGGGLGGLLGGGLGELADRFRQSGRGDVMESWVGTGTNRDIAGRDLEETIGDDTLNDLAQQTGLSRAEIVERLSRELPRAVDQYTPQGRMPQAQDFS